MSTFVVGWSVCLQWKNIKIKVLIILQWTRLSYKIHAKTKMSSRKRRRRRSTQGS